MSVGIRDKIQHLQLSILQDYLEIKLKMKYDDEWINKIIEYCENNYSPSDPRKQQYQNVVDIKRNKGVVMVTKKSFDITLLSSLLRFDFVDDCCADPSDVQVFKKYIKKITENKNKLASHISDLTDKYLISSLENDSLINLRDFILYLDRLGWSSCDETQKDFINKYRDRIQKLYEETSGTKSVQKVKISIAVKDVFGTFISGFRLKIIDKEGKTVNIWTSSDEVDSISVDAGKYLIESVKKPKGYKDISAISISASEGENEKTLEILAERTVTDEELFIEAFDCLSDVKQYRKGISLLEKLAKANYLEAIMLLSFLTDKGLCVEQDSDRAQELATLAESIEKESEWIGKAEKMKQGKKWKMAIPYYLASSMKTEFGDGFFQAARILLIKVKNYEFCKECFRYAFTYGNQDAETPYEYICKIGEENYMRL